MAELVSLLIDGAVAAGTLGLTVLAVYQLRRDRREALARELADRVYVPMRKHAIAWQDPEGIPAGSTWKYIEENVPYLTMRVPSDLRKLFERGDEIERETWVYIGPTTEYVRFQSYTPGTNTTIRFTKGDEFLGEVYMINIWKSGKTFAQYCTDFMGRSHPLVKEWSLVLWAEVPVPTGGLSQQRVGGDKEVNEYADKVFKFLESKPEAVTYRKKYRERAQVGAKAVERIDRELRKRVAPMSSSPAKEPGNPFG